MFLLVPFYQSVILSLLMPKSEGKGKLIHFGVCLPEQIFQKLEDARRNCLRSKFIGQLIERFEVT
jgi:hypothetical protein